MKYYAAVDGDGTKIVLALPHKSEPERNRGQKKWRGLTVLFERYLSNFPEITWADEPVEVLIKVEVVK